MPKQELGAEEQFNLSLSIMGLILREGPHSVQELARYYQVSETAVIKAVKAIANSEDLTRYQTHFYVDEEALEEGEVALNLGVGQLDTPPTLSGKQAAAIAAGLEYLSSVKPFSESRELTELRNLFGAAAEPESSKPTTFDLVLESCQRAISASRQIQIDYLNQLGERSVRLVDPLRLDLIQGRYYLRGWCHKNNDLRAFRLDRIISATLGEAPISDVAREVELPDESFGDSDQEELVTLEIQRTAVELFWTFPLVGEIEETANGLRGQIRVGSFAALGRHIAKFGNRAKVIEPEAARRAVANFAKRALGVSEVEH